MKRVVVLAGMAAVLLSTAACNNSVSGSPTSSATVGATPSGDQPPSSGSGALPINDPCSLLSSSDLQQLGASSPPSQDQVGIAQACEIGTSTASIGVGFEKNLGLSQIVVNGPVTDVQIGSHQAKKMQEASSGGCLVAIGITSSSRVDITVNADSDAVACPIAMKAAQLVEPHVPATG